ncbi:MAG: sulfatase [Candidatus Theseobacter exili]|nr:sulfatase [Candidatus Theseobacter exili]
MKKNPFLYVIIVSFFVAMSFLIILFLTQKNKKVQKPEYNVVFLSLTNLRSDHMSLYGYDRETTRNIDEFGRKSIVFENAFSHASWTLPVGISIFTSTYPFFHKIMNGKVYGNPLKLSRNIITLVDILKKHGYVTAAFTGGKHYAPRYGLIDRFDYSEVFRAYKKGEEPKNQQKLWIEYGYTKDVVPAAINWLTKNKDKKFFLFVQAYDLHCPFATPERNARFDHSYKGEIDFCRCYWTFERTKPITITKNGELTKYYTLKAYPFENKYYGINLSERDIHHMIALYDGEIYTADKWITRVIATLDWLKLTEKTIVVFFSEHGDMFGKYGRFMRGGPLRGTFYDDVLHIPLIIYHPEIKPERISELVQLIDIAPTILDFLGIPIDRQFRGKSLEPLIIEGKPINKYVYAGSIFIPPRSNELFKYPSKIMSIRDKKWKLIKETVHKEEAGDTSFELFDLEKDPDELNNLVEDNKDIVEEYSLKLHEWQKSAEKK